MEIKKIKISPDVVVINPMESNGTKSDEVETKDSATPAPEFQSAWNQLSTLANEICDSKLDTFKFKVSSVTFKRDKLDNLGCMLHLEVQLETSSRPWHSNTPVKYALPEGLDESPKYLSGEGIELLNQLQDLAKKYINGVKAQQDMFTEANATTENSQEDKMPKQKFAGRSIENIINAPKPEVKQTPIGKRIRKDRKTCYDCSQPSSMVVDGIGYCEEHGQARMVPEE